MHDGISKRLSSFTDAWRQSKWIRWVLGAWAVVGGYDLFASQLAPDWLADHLPKVKNLIAATSNWLPWWAWGWMGTAIIAVTAIEYAVKSRNRTDAESKRSGPIKIIFDPEDPRFFRRTMERGEAIIRYRVGILNATPDNRTLYDISLLSDDGDFSREILQHMRGQRLAKWDEINPGVTEWVELFGIAPELDPTEPDSSFWRTPHCFTLETRARDTAPSSEFFVFDVRKRPALRIISKDNNDASIPPTGQWLLVEEALKRLAPNNDIAPEAYLHSELLAGNVTARGVPHYSIAGTKPFVINRAEWQTLKLAGPNLSSAASSNGPSRSYDNVEIYETAQGQIPLS